ncbi:MAG: hypothetical protein JXR78_17400 [Victivallales bacterium]|nr:hypothetical protein [Victivallales bacterium]
MSSLYKGIFVFSLLAFIHFTVGAEEIVFGKFHSSAPCILLGFGNESKVEGINSIAGEVISHDAENMYVSNSALHLRKKGHATQTTLLRWKLPEKLKAGKYAVYSLFTLGGVSPQNFSISAGTDVGHLSQRGEFKQKNIASWKADWQKSSEEIVLTPNDRFIQIEIKGSASLQKVINAFLLEYIGSELIQPEIATILKNGHTDAWLVTLSGGMCGLSLWGIDTEKYLRPGVGDPSLQGAFDGIKPGKWRKESSVTDGRVVIDQRTANYSWSLGTGLAHLYIYSPEKMELRLHVAQSGFNTEGRLNGEVLKFERDQSPPAIINTNKEQMIDSENEQGTKLKVKTTSSQHPVKAMLLIQKGWNRLLLRLHMQHNKDECFVFIPTFSAEKSSTLLELRCTVNDPEADNELKSYARKLNRFVQCGEDMNNIMHPGDPVKVQFQLLSNNPDQKKNSNKTNPPYVPEFPARAKLTLCDYDGIAISEKTVQMTIPGTVEVDFGVNAQAGYYVVHSELYNLEGKIIHVYPGDGFSVVRGTAAQYKRKDMKKMAVTYYFLAGGASSYKFAFPWMRKMGIYRNIGSNPSFPVELAEKAKDEGFILTADFWDKHNAYDTTQREELVKRAAPYTRFFKSFNEIDIHKTVRMTPKKWVARTKGEFEAVKKYDPENSVYVGGSLVRPGSDSWFAECLKLGIDQYIDAWDVHAYPKRPPSLEGTCSNSSNETELGVLKIYNELGRKNTLPFWLGETGARACHGSDARRWQADMVAKMTACISSREDFHYIGFLWPWRCIPSNRPNDISTSHNPADAALYTVSALVDGFPYKKLDIGDNIQAAEFGKTIMLWKEGNPQKVRLNLKASDQPVLVDVIGRKTDLKANAAGVFEVNASSSPVYILPYAEFKRLTAM